MNHGMCVVSDCKRGRRKVYPCASTVHDACQRRVQHHTMTGHKTMSDNRMHSAMWKNSLKKRNPPSPFVYIPPEAWTWGAGASPAGTSSYTCSSSYTSSSYSIIATSGPAATNTVSWSSPSVNPSAPHPCANAPVFFSQHAWLDSYTPQPLRTRSCVWVDGYVGTIEKQASIAVTHVIQQIWEDWQAPPAGTPYPTTSGCSYTYR